MKINLIKAAYSLATAFFILSLMSCNDDNNSGVAHLEVRLTDAPGDYQEVNVDIQEVQVNSQDGDTESGWQSLAINKGVYDLMELTNGIDTLLGSADLPAGKISQIRLVLGTNNTVKLDGQSLPLTTPSAQQSGLKVQVNEELKEGITYTVLLDFDAARSIVATGSGKHNLKPVIRAITAAADGAIQGTVSPIESMPVVYAIIGTDTTSTSASTGGSFLVRGLQAGSYRLVFVPRAGFQSKEVANVNVNVGEVTNVGSVELPGL